MLFWKNKLLNEVCSTNNTSFQSSEKRWFYSTSKPVNAAYGGGKSICQ
jgi:hypothetical protein